MPNTASRRLLLAVILLPLAADSRAVAQRLNPPPSVPARPAPLGTSPPAAPATSITLDDLIRTGLARNPRLARAAFTIDAARGRYTQAGLYPNPVFAFSADELGDRTGPPGILTPQLSQEIVRGGKLQLSRAVVAKEIDQASLSLLSERYALVGSVRA